MCLSRVHGGEAKDGALGAGEAGRCSCWSGRLPGPPPPLDCGRRRSTGEQRAAVIGGDLRGHHACSPRSSDTQRLCVISFVTLQTPLPPLSSCYDLTLCSTSVPAGPSCEAATTCAATASFPLPEGESGVGLSAPYWRKCVCSLTRWVVAAAL